MTDRQRNGFILLLVVGLIAGSIAVLFSMPTRLGLDLKGGVELIYQGEPTAQTPKVTPAALSRAVDVMRQRVDQLGVAEPSIQTQGSSTITVQLPDVRDTARAEALVGSTAQLNFYDWEDNALTPNGKTVASQLEAGDTQASEISQGLGSQIPPGNPGAGSMPLYQAVQLAAKQPYSASRDNSHITPLYYMFGAPGSSACAAAGKLYGVTPEVGSRCLLSGPDTSKQDLISGLPAGVNASEGQILVVKRGTVVLQAANPSASQQIKPASPQAQFFVLRDHVALQGNDITNPQQSTDQSGNPDVSFGFTAAGQKKFQAVTAAIAHRGLLVSIGSQKLFQHFAVALDNQLITVPYIDYQTYPDGIDGSNGADISGSFTIQSAQDLATKLRLGALPIGLKQISVSQVSATLGKQALHQGLIAGLVGLAIVALFLIAFYRVLGVIATAGLIVYGLYFYALIKLIPITLTLPGIAGLILTIGVAADANIVIFERVKEEIRAGRSIRQGILTGYKKGLTAIIDANVVTIMTAFILFVLATADVKGFAFTLGIGTIVSLFTAVMATQAILSTMGSSRVISSPAALGAGRPKRAWRFDFMGASRFFFSMSGVILLVGALAIGGRGLNLGIDFTSGTRISVGLERAATVPEIQSVFGAAGAKGATVQKVTGNSTLGPNGFQISSPYLQRPQYDQVRSQLNSRFGIRNNGNDINTTSVGPTFGSTVANAAIIAIIASLVVISLYVALRFEWKFAIPVLIALMHDLLITSGVYALVGREVTTATVAALLTILGYSLYDTIIVFDRVRENVPRMPRAAFSQIVNRSMSEVLTRSVATTSCTLLPIIALLAFGGSTLRDFAFALLIGVASGAYSSIFIASPVLTHWKEREAAYRHRRERIEAEFGHVPAYASAAADVEPAAKRPRRGGRLTGPAPENVSAAEFEQMKRELGVEEEGTGRRTSTLTKRAAHTESEPTAAPTAGRRARPGDGAPASGTGRRARPADQPAAGGRAARTAGRPAPASPAPPVPAPPAPPAPAPRADDGDGDGVGDGGPVTPAPDIPENEGMVPAPQRPKRSSKSRSRSRRHGRPR
jgi:SecD/SecF fusion protein